MTPLTASRLHNAEETMKRYRDRVTDVQSAAIYKRLLSAWIEVKMMQHHQPQRHENDVDIGTDWIIQLRPNGYNGFHFMRHITQEITRRKEKRIVRICNEIKDCGDGD